MLQPARLLPPKKLLTPRSARRLSTTNRGLLPGAPVPTRTGLSPVSLDQLSGRTTASSLCSGCGGEQFRQRGDVVDHDRGSGVAHRGNLLRTVGHADHESRA